MVGRDKIRRLVKFAILTWLMIAVVLLVLWAAGLFHDMGLDIAGTVALIIGVLLSCALGIALMGLVFYSAESETDQDVYRFGAAQTPPDDDDKRA